jgi:hypothetical protein
MNGRIPNLTDDQSEMVKGIAQILLGVKDLDNRMELAKDQIQKFKDEKIHFNYAGFLSMAGLDNSGEDVYMDIKTQPTHRVHKESTKLKSLLPITELRLSDLVGNQYKWVIGSSEEKSLSPNDKKYVLGMVGKALEAYLYDGNFALNYLEGAQRKEYNRFFETQLITPMLKKIDFTLDNFFKLEGDKVKWKFSPTDTRKMVDEIFRKNSKIPTDVKKAYYEYRLEYAGVKLKENSMDESLIRYSKDIIHSLIPMDTFARHANDPKKNREWVNSLSKDMATLLNRFYKEHNINVVVKI